MIAARPAAHPMIALPLLWGQAQALVLTQAFDWLWFLVVALFGVLCQVFSLYLNDFADEALDRRNQTYWLSGGSRVIPEGRLTGRHLYRGAMWSVGLMLLLSGVSFGLDRAWMPAIAVLALALGWSYSLPPLRASYRGCGEVLQAISCGVVLPVTGFYLQVGSLAEFPWLSLLPLGLLYYASNIVTALPDVVSDEEGGKHSYPVRHGVARARNVALVLSLLACVVAAFLSFRAFSGTGSGVYAAALISAPASILVLLASLSRVPASHRDDASATPPADLQRFMLLTMGSHAWLLLGWTALLFWHGYPTGQ